MQQLEEWPIDRLIDYARNPRKNDHAVDAVAGAIREFGFKVPIVAKSDGTVVDGHLRLKAAKKLKLATVPVLLADDLSDAQVRAFRLSVNKLAELAEWDSEMLANELSDLHADEFDMALLGFDVDELAELLKFESAGDTAEPSGEIVEDEVPEPPVDPITKPGDLWILGTHRLLCGDSTKAADVARLMAGVKADLCFTSPPYDQQRDYTKESKSKGIDWNELMRGVFANLPMTESGQVLVNLGLIHRECEWVPYWDGWIEWMRSDGWRRFGWYVWDQGPGLPGDWNGRFAPSHEFVFHFNRESVRPQKTVDCKHAGETNHGSGLRGKDGEVQGYCHAGDSVQDKKIADSVLRIMRHKARGIECEHPAVFPIALPAFAMQSWPGVAYEPFCGSGSTLIAAEQLNRRCFGMEISPAYCDVIVKRWENLTGRKAVLDGQQALQEASC